MTLNSVYRLILSTILAKQTELAVFIEFGVMEAEAIGIFPEYYREINGKSRNTKTHYFINMWSVFHVHVCFGISGNEVSYASWYHVYLVWE
jgi:hypothetical protein